MWSRALRSIAFASLLALPLVRPGAAAEVGDVAAVPHLGASGREGYATFLLMEFPRVFALSPSGAWAYRSRRTATVEQLTADTLEACNKHSPAQPCRAYAVNGTVVWERPGAEAGPPPLRPVFGELRGSDAFPWRGPEAARGVVVWSHGRGMFQDSRGSPAPHFLRRFAEAGFDVVRFDRDPRYDTVDWAERRMVEGIGLLRAAGYRRVIVAGQSRGAWHSLLVLRHPGLADGVIAAAPATHGSWRMGSWLTLSGLDDFRALIGKATDVRPRVALIVLAGDEFDPDPAARADYARRVLGAAGTPLLVIDRPDGFQGHNAAETARFDARFGDCLLRFMAGETPPAGCG